MFGLKKRSKKSEKTNSENTAVVADKSVPSHIAFICDGNRRWAKNHGKSPFQGHLAGLTMFEDIVDHMLSRGVTTMSFYIFSTENWNRTQDEIDFLMNLFYTELKKKFKHAVKKNIRYKIVGERSRLPERLAKLCDKLELESAENTGGTVVFALNYGGQDEIVRGAQNAIASGIPADELDRDTFEAFLDTGDILPIDLMVRTSNEFRISNFLLWKLAYAELMFVPEHWPDMSTTVIDRVIAEFAKRNRRFGGGKYVDYSADKKVKSVKQKPKTTKAKVKK